MYINHGYKQPTLETRQQGTFFPVGPAPAAAFPDLSMNPAPSRRGSHAARGEVLVVVVSTGKKT